MAKSPLTGLLGSANMGGFFAPELAWAGFHHLGELPQASPHPAGGHPIVIDYALAKGLAHEAFGPAAEADGFRSSVLARHGRFRAGERVGPDHVSIIDEPIAGDHAWQPFGLNGAARERTVIVERGTLRDALADAWTAEAAGTRATGAERAESFRSAPLPRMSNIRIESTAPLAAPGTFEDYGPDEVRDLLATAGVLDRHPRVAYLSGYAGGQVNTATGDFVFHCQAIYTLGLDLVTLHRPAIFAGSMFGALGALREVFGPLLLDAIGTCGKWGQSVPSSGGSHWFLVLQEFYFFMYEHGNKEKQKKIFIEGLKFRHAANSIKFNISDIDLFCESLKKILPKPHWKTENVTDFEREFYITKGNPSHWFSYVAKLDDEEDKKDADDPFDNQF